MPKYHPSIPNQCPPRDAEAYKGVLYRRVRKIPVGSNDFLSHKERDIKCTRDECQCWGISVWIDTAAVEHAKKILPGLFKKGNVVQLEVTKNDGVIAKTPSDEQPDHHTYWADIANDFSTRCELMKEQSA